MKTSDLIGPALDWAVAKCEGAENLRENPHRFDRRLILRLAGRTSFINDLRFSTDWAQAGPIIEREGLCVNPDFPRGWMAITNNAELMQFGPTPLIAAMRCYCCAKLGDEIEIPEELQPCHQPNL